uniref:Copia-type pol polyprotein n=1 Tax=Oryza sativa subsp. japonica TaxID=39947 RepID=Q8S5R3_ORYSJ|nr:Putative copia-type pol polyprotein [Oryza sativa Japonica Group]
MEILKGQFERFVMLDGESPSDMYDRLSKIVNEIKGLGSKDMTDEVVVKKMVRAITPRNFTLVTIIRERPDYKTLTPHDLLGRILAHDMLVQESKDVIQYINQSSTASIKKEDLALKAKEEEEENRKSKSKAEIDDEEMALFVKKFGKFMRRSGFFKGGSSKHYSNKSSGRHSARVCYVCKEPGHFIADCPHLKDGSHIKEDKKKDEKKEKHKHSKSEHYGQAHLGMIFGSDSKSSSSDEEGVATFAVKPSSPPRLFNYSSDENAKVPSPLKSFNVDLVSDEEDEVEDEVMDDELFKSITKESLPHLSELLGRIEDQYVTLERQETLLIHEKERSHELKSELAKEREKNEALVRLYKQTKESHANLEVANAQLQERVDGLDKAYLTLEEKFKTLKNSVSLPSEPSCSKIVPSNEPCVRCKDIDIEACATNSISLSALQKQNEKLMGLLHNGLLKCHMDSKALKEYLGYQRDNFYHQGLGYVPPPKEKVDKSVLIRRPQDNIVFGDDGKGKVMGLGKIAISNDLSIANVLLVKSLNYNLLSVSQLCSMGYNCLFTDVDVTVYRRNDSSVVFKDVLKGKLYLVDFSSSKAKHETCLVAKSNTGWLWHRRLAHVGMRNLHKLLKHDHILGQTNVQFEKDRVCSAYQAGKQIGAHHPVKNVMTTTRPLELLHMDLFGPIAYLSIGGNKYGLVIVDDFSRFTWVFFLHDKSETQAIFKKFARRAQNEFDLKIKNIRSDNGKEFKNTKCYILNKKARSSKFAPKVDEGFLLGYGSNECAYRVFNKTSGIVEIARDVTFEETNGSQVEQVDSHVLGEEEDPSEAIKRLALGDVRPREPQQGVSSSTQVEPPTSTQANDPSISSLDQGEEGEQVPPSPINLARPRIHQSIQRDHPTDNILGDINKGVSTRSRIANFCEHYSFVSSLEPLRVEEALNDPDWVMAMQEELNNFTQNEVWNLVERARQNVIGTKWIFRNKQDEAGVVIRNKARLVAQGFTQIEGLDFGETFAPVARLESIRILLAFVTNLNFKLYQMDVKSTFLNGPMNELVYVEQPPGFEDPKYPNRVYKLHKALYGLKQAPRACEEFSRMMTKRFEMSMMGELKFFLVLQIKQLKEGTFICQTKYLKDMLKKFGMENAKPIHTPMPSNGHLDFNEQGKDVDQKVYRSIIGSLLYLCASRPDIMLSVCMCARFQAAPKECHLVAMKRILRYLVHTPNLGLWYPKGARFDLIGYANVDYAGCKVDRKSTSGTCQFLGRSLVSWSSKKQNSVVLSTTEAEYVSAGSCCAQLLWMKQTLRDYGLNVSKIPLLCDNESAIKIANNPIQHSRTKHIDIRHHFLRDHSIRGDIDIQHVRTDKQLADIFTKPLDEARMPPRKQTSHKSKRPRDRSPTPSSHDDSDSDWSGGEDAVPQVAWVARRSTQAHGGGGDGEGSSRQPQTPPHQPNVPIGPLRIHTPERDPAVIHQVYDWWRKSEVVAPRRDEDLRSFRRTATDLRFWTLFQQDFYESVIKSKTHPTVPMQWINWEELQAHNDPVIDSVIANCDLMGIRSFMTLQQNWCNEVIAQFYATVYFDRYRAMHWMTQGSWYSVSYQQLAEIWGFRLRSLLNLDDLHNLQILANTELLPLYTPNDPNVVLGKVDGLKPYFAYLNRMFRRSFVPKDGDASSINHLSRTVLLRFDPPPHRFHVYHFVWEEIRMASIQYKKGLVYAPHIMWMIETVTQLQFRHDVTHSQLQLRLLKAPRSSAARDIPSSSTQPPPAPERPASVARREPSPLFRILRSLFGLCSTEAKKNHRLRNSAKKTARDVKFLKARYYEDHHIDIPPSPPGFEAEPDEPEDEEIEDPFAGLPSDFDFFGYGHGYGYPPPRPSLESSSHRPLFLVS